MTHRGIKTNWVIWYAICLHISWSVLLFVGGAQHTTAIDSLLNLFGDYRVTAAVIGGAGVLALIGIVFERRFAKWGAAWGITTMGLQQYLLLMSAGAAIRAISDSSFADGVIRPRTFIASDQLPSILAAVFHSFALIEHYIGLNFIRGKARNLFVKVK